MPRFAFPAAALVALVALLGCGGTKRPPAVTTDTGSSSGAAGGLATEADRSQPLDAGPDLRPLDNEGARGADLAYGSGAGAAENGPLGDVFFAYDSAALSDEALGTLEAHASWLAQNPWASVTIEGHCDERGTVEYNLALGDQRARAVKEYLVSRGVADERLVTVSYGKERPLDPGSGEAAWSRNRRAHFVVGR